MKMITPRNFVLALLLACGFGLPGNVLAQDIHYVCGSDELHEHSLANSPATRAAEEETERRYVEYLRNLPGTPAGGRMVKTIPVVVHFIQSAAIDLIPDSEVFSQIDVLNEDYRKLANTPGDGGGVDTEYEFCLASIDPNGCPTTGINRIVNPSQAFHDRTDPAALKSLIQWDPNKYLNIWVPRTIEGNNGLGQVIGYATFPSGLLLEPELDGIVVHGDFFGRNSNPQYNGRTTTHEVGHWLGLFHPFQGGCAGSTASTCATAGDRVCDTPQAANANFQCPTINSCVDSPVDEPDQVENYMDYADGSCQNMFTQGQKDRMDLFHQTWRSQISTAANLTATGCDGSVSPGCAPTAAFSSSIQSSCVGEPITFNDLSSGPATSWNWSFPGGNPATSTDQNPVVTYSAPGSYTVTLTATNSLGTDDETTVNYIEIVEADSNPIMEGFEGILFYPQGWFTRETPGTNTWTLTTAAAFEGVNSMIVENYQQDNAGAFADLTSRVFDMSNVLSADLSWEYAYKRYNAFQIDTFTVRVSNDCGSTWNEVWSETGPFLPTVGGNSIGFGWAPNDTSQWRTVTVNIDTLVLLEPSVRFQFRVVSSNGQNLYLDNIRMTTTLVNAAEGADRSWSVTVSPNPFTQNMTVHYELARASDVRFVLTDVSGKILLDRNTGKQAPGMYQLNEEDFAQLPGGVYFLRVESDFGTVTKKVVKMSN